MEGQTILELVEQNRWLNSTEYGGFYFGIDDMNAIKGRDFVVRMAVYLVLIWLLSRWVREEVVPENRVDGNDGTVHEYAQFTGEDLGEGEGMMDFRRS